MKGKARKAVAGEFLGSAGIRAVSNRNSKETEFRATRSKQRVGLDSNRNTIGTIHSTPFFPALSRGIAPQCILVRMVPLEGRLEFDPAWDADFFRALPSRPGVVRFAMRRQGAEPYLIRTADIRRAAERVLKEPEAGSKRLNLREVAAGVAYRATGSKFEQLVTMYGQAKIDFPRRYRDLLRLRPPALLKVNLNNDYPRCYVTRRIRADGGFYFGPFPSRRGAEAFAEGFLDLFKTRRCQIKIRRDPSYPGCIYSEMKMCLAPCFAGCTREEYDAEASRMVEALATSGASLTESLERERENASQSLDFERAAALHKRIEKVSAALRVLPEAARRVDELDAVILTRAVEPKTILVFPIHAGILRPPIFLGFGENSSGPRSVETLLRGELEPAAEASAAANPRAAEEENWRKRQAMRQASPELPEHLALLARWFYSKPREGEIFFRDAAWPYRRILRACGRLLAGTSGEDSGAAAPAPPT
ncbi:MAG TPA: UvrB/UvrC motif-containing protein [Verrucomicrobiae bacterium]|nr:UvrB/UvrC motif-containing protein [Verrucomicrobiae bacterium]